MLRGRRSRTAATWFSASMSPAARRLSLVMRTEDRRLLKSESAMMANLALKSSLTSGSGISAKYESINIRTAKERSQFRNVPIFSAYSLGDGMNEVGSFGSRVGQFPPTQNHFCFQSRIDSGNFSTIFERFGRALM